MNVIIYEEKNIIGDTLYGIKNILTDEILHEPKWKSKNQAEKYAVNNGYYLYSYKDRIINGEICVFSAFISDEEIDKAVLELQRITHTGN